MPLRRRLLMAAAILFGASLAASVIAPPPRDADDGRTTPAIVPAGPAAPAAGELAVTQAPPAEEVRARTGEIVLLVVEVDAPTVVEVDGRREDAEPGTPARFEFIPEEPGELEITAGDPPVRIGTLQVSG